MIQKPVQELQELRTNRTKVKNLNIAHEDVTQPEVQGKKYELIAELDAGDAEKVGFKVRKGENDETIIGYDVKKQELYVDRTNSGEVDFDSSFASIQRAPMRMKNNRIRMHIFVDWSSIEVLGDKGQVAITERIFPAPESEGFELFSEGGTATMISMDIWKLNSVWEDSVISSLN